MLSITVKPRDEHNLLDRPATEPFPHLLHPFHNLVRFALRKVREPTYASPRVHDDDLTWASAVRCETRSLRGVDGDRE